VYPDTHEVPERMRQFALSILGRAVYDATFAEITRPFAHALAVVHAAHGAEIAIKARIAQEHPLLIFSKLPRPTSSLQTLTTAELVERGRSVGYDALPALLWATTGYRMQKAQEYQRFGRLRNKIVHFAAPDIDHSREVLRYCTEVLEPMIYDFWGCSVLEQSQEWDEVVIIDGYLAEQLDRYDIQLPDCSLSLFQAHGRAEESQ
jgi:hypothetical protein